MNQWWLRESTVSSSRSSDTRPNSITLKSKILSGLVTSSFRSISKLWQMNMPITHPYVLVYWCRILQPWSFCGCGGRVLCHRTVSNLISLFFPFTHIYFISPPFPPSPPPPTVRAGVVPRSHLSNGSTKACALDFRFRQDCPYWWKGMSLYLFEGYPTCSLRLTHAFCISGSHTHTIPFPTIDTSRSRRGV